MATLKLISKYFWDLNEKALRETEKIIRSPRHPMYARRMVALLSRCQQPRELFSLISKNEFIKGWPEVKSYWFKIDRSSDFRDWWQTIYEQMMQKHNPKRTMAGVKTFDVSLRIGRLIWQSRIKKGISQKEFALRLGMKQPDISNIEKGKKNITLETLAILCKALEIKKIELWR